MRIDHLINGTPGASFRALAAPTDPVPLRAAKAQKGPTSSARQNSADAVGRQGAAGGGGTRTTRGSAGGGAAGGLGQGGRPAVLLRSLSSGRRGVAGEAGEEEEEEDGEEPEEGEEEDEGDGDTDGWVCGLEGQAGGQWGRLGCGWVGRVCCVYARWPDSLGQG